MRLHVVVCSTRPGRQGPAVARWASESAAKEGSFEVELVDLAAFDLPVFDETRHPMLQQYEREHTKRWAAKIAGADAFLFVMPEYNYFPPSSLVNAIDFLVKEWQYKPAAFVAYGGMSGGLRAVQAAKPLLTTLKMMPIPEAVALPFFGRQIVEGVFEATEGNEEALRLVVGELAKWAGALKALR